VDRANAALFGGLAADWWNPEGSSKLLHRINPLRLGFIRDAAVAHFGRDARSRHALEGLRALDVGCGAGLVAEPLARMGATVTGLDAAPENIAVARAHAAVQDLAVSYVADELADFAKCNAHGFELVTMLEVVEHVTDVAAFVSHIAAVLAPGGLLVFSTPNRTVLSRAVMITGAERVARVIPRGGHDWQQFRTPEELAGDFAVAGLRMTSTQGISWLPGKGFHLSKDRRVNYIGTAVLA
jgi:2-polyprenyl-6-hydroxyphenyl methylase/3-demethylubiquinone-9 3-methyltransferase